MGTKDQHPLLLLLTQRPPARPPQLGSKDHDETRALPQVTVCAAGLSNGAWLGQPITPLIRNYELIELPGANGFSFPLS